MTGFRKSIGLKHQLGFASLALVFTFSSCSKDQSETLPFFNTAAFAPEWISPGTDQYTSIHVIPPFALTNQDADTVTEKNLDGKIVVVDFFFTSCPGICPRLTKNLGVVQDAFRDDSTILLLSYSVTPDIDSISRLKDYAIIHHVISGKWHLLTGTRKEIYSLARNGYFADEEVGIKKDEGDFIHTENFVLIDEQRRIRGVYNGTNLTEIERLNEDIRILKMSH